MTRQTSVLAYQLGDGFSNILTPPQGYFMAALALASVPWARWASFIWPLQLAWLVVGLALLLIAHAIGLVFLLTFVFVLSALRGYVDF